MTDLDKQVAEVLGYKTKIDRYDGGCRANINGGETYPKFSPSTNWRQGGPLIEEYRVALDSTISRERPVKWTALIVDDAGKCFTTQGKTPLIAAMKALIASKQ